MQGPKALHSGAGHARLRHPWYLSRQANDRPQKSAARSWCKANLSLYSCVYTARTGGPPSPAL